MRVSAMVLMCGASSILPAQAGNQQQPEPPPAIPNSNSAAAAPAESLTGLRPAEIYKQAMHPLDVVRSSLDNWSDTELSALSMGMHKAAEACAQNKAENYTGDDLYDFARLCTFAQSWVVANNAASRYLDSRAEPHRTQAYALSMNALMHMGSKDLALDTAQLLLHNQPFDAEVAFALRYEEDALDKDSDADAIGLARQESPALIEALRKRELLKARQGDAVMDLGTLYASAMELAFWDRYAGDDAEADKIAAACDEAIGDISGLPEQDRQRIESVRTQFRLLGQRLPTIKVLETLQSGKAKAEIDPFWGVATALVLYPDWCAQCRKMMKTLTAFAIANGRTPIHAYGLMFADEEEGVPQAVHEQAVKELRGTATLLVSPDAAKTLGAIDYPLGIVVDREGRVRYIGPLAADAFNGNGKVEQILKRIAARADPPKPQ